MVLNGKSGADGMLERTSTRPKRDIDEPVRNKRYIYNGDARSPAAGYAFRPNKRGTRRRVSTFNLILLLFSAGIAIVLYVNNIITVNRLAFEVEKLHTKVDSIRNTNAALHAEVDRKAAQERIGPIAIGRLKLLYPREQPIWIEIDEAKLKKIKHE